MTDRSDTDRMTLHDLGIGDSGRGFLLSTEIGWNQVEADWTYMLENGTGIGMTDDAGKLVASAMALPYGGFGWVCMVLVAPDWRRKGLATDLMNRVISVLQSDGIVPGLDATPDGREVYRQIGFMDVYGIERLIADRAAISAAPSVETEFRPLTAQDLTQVAEFDAPVFGGDRGALLRHLQNRQPMRASGAWRDGELIGYALARDGRTWTQIGPVIANDQETAKALIAAAANQGTGPDQLLIDMPDFHLDVLDWLKEGGFEFQRPYIRMIHGSDRPLDHKSNVFCLAGPELG